MNEPEFEQFGLDWREEAPVEEARVFRRLAQRASRKGRLLVYADLALGAVAVIGGLAAIVIYRTPMTTAVACLLVALVSWYSWRRYRLHAIQGLVTRTDRETMLASAAATLSARLRSSTLGLALLLPSWLLGVAFKSMIELDGDARAFLKLLLPSLSTPWPMAAVAALFAAAIWFGRQNIRLRRELRAIEALRAQYRAETRLDRSTVADA